MTTDTPTAPADPRATVERVQRTMNAHDLDTFVACFAPDYASEQPAHPDRAFRGRDQIRHNWARLFASIPEPLAALLGAAGVGRPRGSSAPGRSLRRTGRCSTGAG
ncbi:MAG TPA: nuclear transport factor 2 family protein [Chloroflexota bacterium]|nr:nuclear transport factor 2 family protein [Chloroflexota bacterium]